MMLYVRHLILSVSKMNWQFYGAIDQSKSCWQVTFLVFKASWDGVCNRLGVWEIQIGLCSLESTRIKKSLLIVWILMIIESHPPKNMSFSMFPCYIWIAFIRSIGRNAVCKGVLSSQFPTDHQTKRSNQTLKEKEKVTWGIGTLI